MKIISQEWQDRLKKQVIYSLCWISRRFRNKMTGVALLMVSEVCLSSTLVDTMMEPLCACAKHIDAVTDLIRNPLTALMQMLHHINVWNFICLILYLLYVYSLKNKL